jgi:hypothetical protein
MAGWSTLQLTEFFSAITRAGTIVTAARLAVQRATEATDAEVAAVVYGDDVPASVGLGRAPSESLFTSLDTATDTASFPGVGPMHLTVHTLDRDTPDRLIVARADEPFTAEERQMLQGMARVTGLALRGLRTLEAERQLRLEREREAGARLELVQALERRERLLETLLRVQRSANQRTPLAEILDMITSAASGLLDGVPVALVLRDLGQLRSLSRRHPDRGGPARDQQRRPGGVRSADSRARPHRRRGGRRPGHYGGDGGTGRGTA